MLLKKIYCRMFQACFGLGARVLPWRRPECITGAGDFQQGGLYPCGPPGDAVRLGN